MSFESIHNYYEQLVLSRITELQVSKLAKADENLLCDITCVALNQLPARYVRHNVDMLFYMPIKEREQIDEEVANAVDAAIEYVSQHSNEQQTKTAS